MMIKNDKPFTYEKFKKIYSQVPRLAVDVIVQSPQGIALTLRSIVPHRDYWHIPGGTVLYGETIAQAATRIAWRELHLRVQIKKLLGYLEYNEERLRGFGRSVNLVFLCEATSGTLAPNQDARDAQYFKTLPKKMILVQKAFLKKYLQLPRKAN